MFGSKPSGGPGQTGGPWGASTASSQPAPTAPSNPFANLGSTAATTSEAPKSFFSNLGGASSAAQPGQSTAAATGGLFNQTAGTSGSSQFPGLKFGASTAQPQQTNAAGSTFGSTTGQTQQNTAGQQAGQQAQNGPLAQSANILGPTSAFDHLLEKGRKRNNAENGINQFGELPPLQLGLGDIARKVRNLGTGGPTASQVQDKNAHYLLAASGVPTGSTLRDLHQFSAQSGLGTAAGNSYLVDTDVDGYIANLHSQSTLALIEEGLEQSKRDFDNFLEDNVQMEWDKQRQKIYEHFGLGKQSERAAADPGASGSVRGAFGRSSRRGRAGGASARSGPGASFGASGMRSVLGSSFSGPHGRSINAQDVGERAGVGMQTGPENRYIRDKQEKYMAKVTEFNEERQRRNLYPVLSVFAEVERESDPDTTQKLVDAYKALIAITGEDPKLKDTPDAVKERHYAKLYLNEDSMSPQSVQMRKRILDGSRKFLEKQYLKKLDDALDKNPREAQLGGIPSISHKVQAYIRLKLAFKELGVEKEQLKRFGTEGEDYPWVVLFHLLRCGLVSEAYAYADERKNFFKSDTSFLKGLKQYASDPERRLGPENHRNIANTYAQRIRVAVEHYDPYCLACYKIVGRCDLTRRTLENLNQDMEDWVWLQFSLAREGNRSEESADSTFGLEELRASFHEIGQRHFSSGSDAAGGYGVYFYLAILAGLFEEAVGHLHQHNYTSAVHFAIALEYYGLLRVSNWETANGELVTFDTRQQKQINFGLLVGQYTSDFRTARAKAAAEYLILICLNADLPGEAGKRQRNLCYDALRELVLETREFAELLGDVRGNGTSTPGLIQQRLDLIKLDGNTDYIKTITTQAAKAADDSGRTTDAVLLYHLAEDYDSVISILNRAVSEALSVDIGQEPLRLEPLKPRTTVTGAQQQAQLTDPASSSTLSLAGIDEPSELAQKMVALYSRDAAYYGNISEENRQTIERLLRLCNAKQAVQAGQWFDAVDIIREANILPLDAKGSLPAIRSSANNFSAYPPDLARNIGNVLMWSIVCLGRKREQLLGFQYVDANRQGLADDCLQMAKDLMIFAGLIRYKLPPRVFESLATAGQNVGAY